MAGNGIGRLAALALLLLAAAAPAPTVPPNHRPVKVVAPGRLAITTPHGSGQLALYISADWTKPQPGIVRALVIVHGYTRLADSYWHTGLTAATDAGLASSTLVIAPHFLADIDVAAHHLPASVLRWTTGSWEGGADALGPAPISSYAALDAIVARLADRRLFPNLREVIVAGHSGGGQVVQRYAILAANPPPGITVRYVVANPSSYAYFDAWRPEPVSASACPRYDTWKYGMHDLPPYAGNATPTALEQRYIARNVTYLLGTADTNPHQESLDRSCMGEAQGPYRLARGRAYLRHLRARDPAASAQRLYLIPGVAHSARAMFTSACGVSALWDKPGCAPASP